MEGPGYEKKKGNVGCSGRPSSTEGFLDLGFLSEPPEKLLKILVSRPCCQSPWGHDPGKCTRTICSSSAAFVVKIKGEIYSMKSIPHWTLLCSVTQSCLTLCKPMGCSTPGFPVLHYLPELVQIHVHWVGDAIPLSYPLSPLSPPALSLSQH